MFALRQATRTLVQTSARRSFTAAAPLAVPSLRKSRLPRARGINSTPVVEVNSQSPEDSVVPASASIDETIVHEYPEEHEFDETDLVRSALQSSSLLTLTHFQGHST